MSEVAFSPPLIELAFEPRDPADRTGLLEAVQGIAQDTDGVRLIEDDYGAFILEFTDMLIVSGVRERITACEFAATLGLDQIAFREGLRNTVQTTGTFKPPTGGDGQFAEVTILFEPVSGLTGNTVESREGFGNVPERFLPAVERGILSALASGVIAGFPVVGIRAVLLDGKFHDTASSDAAFEEAARAAAGALKDVAVFDLLVPAVSVTVTCPPEYEDAIGRIFKPGYLDGVAVERDGPVAEFSAIAEVTHMMGLARKIDGISKGQATCTIVFDHYRVTGHDGGGDNTFPAAAAMKASVA